jgi:hypothetical protein
MADKMVDHLVDKMVHSKDGWMADNLGERTADMMVVWKDERMVEWWVRLLEGMMVDKKVSK